MTATSPDRPVLFTGSFNPFTIGHADIVSRALAIFGRVVIGVGINVRKPGAAEDAEASADAIRALYAAEPRVEVVTFSGLAVECARSVGARALLRGARSVADFEYERDMADVNRRIAGIDTVILPADPALACVSSSTVRELQAFGADISQFLPKHES